MENRKIRVAITHGDTNGIGYELIFKALEDPMMRELCTPIIYGSPKVATYHRKALDIQANFTIINNAESREAISDREREIIVCLVQGLSNKEIADRLCISIHTVITHRRNIARKLQIHSLAGLTLYAIANNLIDRSIIFG